MEKNTNLINYIQEMYDIATQMLMFKDQSNDNPLFQFLLRSVITTDEKYLDSNFSIYFNDEFLRSLLEKINNLKIACEVYLSKSESQDLFNNALLDFVKLHQQWIIYKTDL